VGEISRNLFVRGRLPFVKGFCTHFQTPREDVTTKKLILAWYCGVWPKQKEGNSLNGGRTDPVVTV